jgi:type I restriction enzyme M protein
MLTSQTIKTIQDIMRKDVGVDGDAQRIGQLGWMIFLKILDDQEQEYELLDDKYRSPIPEKLRWRNWAANAEGITGDALLDFVNNELFRRLKDLPNGNPRALVIRSAFEDAYNYMKSGTLLRQVVNKLNEDFDFNRSDDRHVFNDIYEQILKDLQSAGNAGEYYTPRAVTQFAVEMVDPKLGETVLDPACGTGGFLTCAIEHVRKRYVKSVEDDEKLQRSIQGVDKKQLPHLLAVTNMLLHGMAVPSNIRHDNTLGRPLRDYGPRDRVDVIVTNPPFGGMEEDGIEMNFPQALRTRETADLFLVLIMHLLKDGGRAAIVLPDGTLFGEGVKTRIKEKLLTECNLHTIVRLPNGVFNPYTGIKTNILFFEKGKPTKHIWYYEHPYPPGQKSYNKTNPIRIEEFEPEKKWWKKRVENEHAWKVEFKKLLDETKARAQPRWEAAEKYEKEALGKKGDEQERVEGLARSERAAGDAIYATAFNLDRKNAHTVAEDHGDPEELLQKLDEAEKQAGVLRDKLKAILEEALLR